MTPELTKATEITKTRLALWRTRNRDEGVACTPVVLVSAMGGDKSGLVLNLVTEVPLGHILKVLEIATEQVRKKIEEQSNGATQAQV